MPAAPYVELTTLRILRDKNILSDAEYQAALRDLSESTSRGGEGLTFVVGKLATTFYGFIELNTMYDTTQSFSDVAGNAQVVRQENALSNHPRTQFSIRDSRFGFRIKGPSAGDVRTSANLEMDFFGTPGLPLNNGQPYGITESYFYVNPVLRVRHANMRIETPVVDLLLGQSWNLFGWQPIYFPNTIDLQGLPAQLFSRSAQIRLSKTLRAHGVTFEAAVAVSRPPQRDTATPDGQAGLRIAIDGWTALHTMYAPSTVVAPASLGISGVGRRISIPEFSANPTARTTVEGGGVALDAFIPLIPATKERPDNSLALVGEFVMGGAISDLYTAFSGGVTSPPLPNPTGATPAPAYPPPDVDPGLVAYGPDGTLHPIRWTTYLGGAQYRIPGVDGRLWLSGTYSHSESPNSNNFGAPTRVRIAEDWFSVSAWGDVTEQVRLGAGYSTYDDVYGDGQHAKSRRLGFTAFYLF